MLAIQGPPAGGPWMAMSCRIGSRCAEPGLLDAGLRHKSCCLRYNSTMQSELHFILFLLTPWVLLLAAVFFYRQRRKHKTLNDSGDGHNGGGRGD